MSTSEKEDDYTAVTVYFRGKAHTDAAKAFLVQFADGGMDEDIEVRLAGQGHTVGETDFDIEGRGITIVLE